MQVNTTSGAKRLPRLADASGLAELEGTCVSIYLAGHKGGSGSRPMRVRLHAMLTEAERLLEARGVLSTDRASLLAPLHALGERPELNAGSADGLAVFKTSRRLEQMTLPWEVDDLIAVEGAPMVTPLLHGLSSHREFFLLALSKKNTRLFECGPASQQAVELPDGLYTSLEEFGGFDEAEQSRGRAGSGATFSLHTHADKEIRYLYDFCRALDQGLRPLFEERGWPVVLAAAPSELGVYREVNSYGRLVDTAVEGSPDSGATDAELAAKGRAVISTWRPAAELHAVELFLRAGSGVRSTEIEEILREAAAGRVMHLFLSGDAGQTGDVDRILGRVLPSGAPRGTADHLANAAAVETWRHGGTVWWLAEPVEQSAVAAVFRW